MGDPIQKAVDGLLSLTKDERSYIERLTRRPRPSLQTCPRCRGEGTIDARRTRFNPASWSRPLRIACPTCDGTGKL